MRLEKITQRNKIGKREEGLEINPEGPQHLMVQKKRKCWKRNLRKLHGLALTFSRRECLPEFSVAEKINWARIESAHFISSRLVLGGS